MKIHNLTIVEVKWQKFIYADSWDGGFPFLDSGEVWLKYIPVVVQPFKENNFPPFGLSVDCQIRMLSHHESHREQLCEIQVPKSFGFDCLVSTTALGIKATDARLNFLALMDLGARSSGSPFFEGVDEDLEIA